MHSADDIDFVTLTEETTEVLHSYTHELVHVPSSPLKARNDVTPSQVGGSTLYT